MEDFVLYTFMSLTFILFISKFLFSKRPRYANLPPSPPSLPIIGHLHLLKTPVYRTFHRLSQTYGPIFSLRLGSRRVVIVSSSAAVEECFTKNDIVLANRPRGLIGKYIGYNWSTMISAPYGDHWRNLRRISAIEIFSSQRLNMFSTVRKDEVKHLVRKLAKNSGSGNFSKVEMKSMFNELSFNIIMTMVAGKRYYGDDIADSDKEEATKFRQIMTEVLSSGSTSNLAELFPVLKWFGMNIGREKKMEELGKRSDAFLQGLIDEHKGVQRNSMIDHLLSLQESQPEYYTDEIIKGLIMVLVQAGTDTSAVALEWIMSNLLNHPRVLNKARLEMDSHLGPDRLVDEPDVTKLPYLQSIISETLRLHPPPLLVPHFSSEDCTIGGFDVPRDTTVMVNAWAMHRDPELWDDPESFKPERFQSGESESYKFLPFGLGRRACPGMGLAQREVGLTLGTLIQCFDWERVDDENVDMTAGKGVTNPKAVPLEALCRALPIVNKILT